MKTSDVHDVSSYMDEGHGVLQRSRIIRIHPRKTPKQHLRPEASRSNSGLQVFFSHVGEPKVLQEKPVWHNVFWIIAILPMRRSDFPATLDFVNLWTSDFHAPFHVKQCSQRPTATPQSPKQRFLSLLSVLTEEVIKYEQIKEQRGLSGCWCFSSPLVAKID